MPIQSGWQEIKKSDWEFITKEDIANDTYREHCWGAIADKLLLDSRCSRCPAGRLRRLWSKEVVALGGAQVH
jgi:hypothetical protein